MRIVIDMQGAQSESRFRGIGRYTLSLAKAISRNRGEHDIILALNGLFAESVENIRAAFEGVLPRENICVWYAPGPQRYTEQGLRWRREIAERIREAFLASLAPDVVLVSSIFEGYSDDAVTSISSRETSLPTAVILYDLIPFLKPEIYLAGSRLYSDFYASKMAHLKRAHLWLAISGSSAEEGRKALGLPKDALVNISSGCDSIFRKVDFSETEKQRLLDGFNITSGFVLYTGGADDRKNLERLIRAYASLEPAIRGGRQLVLCGQIHEGKVAELRRIANEVDISDKELIFTKHVSDDELVGLYNLCEIFVFPSLHEGFGLPVVEAMACGAAVVCSNVTSLPEVAGRDDVLFDPYNELDISQKLRDVLTNEQYRETLRAYGQRQAEQFSWDSSARKTISALESLVGVNAKASSQPIVDEHLNSELIGEIAGVIPLNVGDDEIVAIAYSISLIDNLPKAKQLFVDVSELAQRDARTGVQRVTRSILKELLERPPDGYVVEPVFASQQTRGYRYARSFTKTFCGRASELGDDPIEYRSGDIFLGLDLQHGVTRAQAQHLNKMRRDGVAVYFVVYDLLPVKFPQYWPENTIQKAHHEWLTVVSQYDGAICISKAVADELSDWVKENNITKSRIGWFHLGADFENSVPSRGLPENANQQLGLLRLRPTFLTVGTLEPRKGHAQLLDAMEILWSDGADYNLAIVGKKGWMVESLVERIRSHRELDRRLFWFEAITDEYLDRVYAASSCLVVCSEGEGFGLPIIEAAQHNVPLLVRDIPVFREVAGEHACYFSGKTADLLASAICSWNGLNEQGKAPRAEKIPWKTWKESANELLRCILGERSLGLEREKQNTVLNECDKS